jgi:hypothetical protein
VGGHLTGEAARSRGGGQAHLPKCGENSISPLRRRVPLAGGERAIPQGEGGEGVMVSLRRGAMVCVRGRAISFWDARARGLCGNGSERVLVGWGHVRPKPRWPGSGWKWGEWSFCQWSGTCGALSGKAGGKDWQAGPCGWRGVWLLVGFVRGGDAACLGAEYAQAA